MNEDQILRTARDLPFKPHEIYAAFESPTMLAAWWGPTGFTNSFEIFEFTTNGRWKFVMHGPDGKSYQNESRFGELIPNSKIVINHNCPPQFTLTITLTHIEKGTHLLWEQVFCDAETTLAVKEMAGPANEQNIDRLTAKLASILKTSQ